MVELGYHPLVEELPEFDKECFLVSPIGELGSFDRSRADEVREFVLEPAISGLGLVIVRADDISAPGDITEQVVEHTVNAKAVVADLTGTNANVFYELGIRHSVGRPVVMITEDKSLPFDVAGLRVVMFDRGSPKSVAECKRQIIAQLTSALDVYKPPFSILAPPADLSSHEGDGVEDGLARTVENLERTSMDVEGVIANLEEFVEGAIHYRMASLQREELDVPLRWLGQIRRASEMLGGTLRKLLGLRLGLDEGGVRTVEDAASELGLSFKEVLTMEAQLAELFTSPSFLEELSQAELWWPGREVS